MKINDLFLAFFLLLITFTSEGAAQERSINSSLDFFGLSVPASTLQRFAPGLVSTKYYSYGGTFSPSMDRFYFLRQKEEDGKVEFVAFTFSEGEWTESVQPKVIGQPFFSPNGQIMHFGAKYRKQTKEGWSEVLSLGPEFEKFEIMRMTSSAYSTYVFDEAGWPDGDGVLRFSEISDGSRLPPIPFPKHINTGKFNAHPYIAPDESFLIWDSKRESGFGGSDIYISFRTANGAWGKAINMGPTINSEGWDAAASLSPDGRYFFFHRLNAEGNANIYWVDASIIEQLKAER